jgi:hypothetical protein
VQSGQFASADEMIDKLVQEYANRTRQQTARPTHANTNKPNTPHADEAAEETAFDVAKRAGLIGCIKGAPRSPTDLSTNPKHMEGFGRG